MAGTNDIRLPPKWIELNITKRECSSYIATVEDENICQCGNPKNYHANVKHLHRLDSIWTPAHNTSSFPTDAFGSVIFEGEHHPNKAGLNDGVAKHIGMALHYERNTTFKKGTRVVTLQFSSIAPWGLVEHREELLVKNKDKVYNPLEHAQSKFKCLNPKHNNFLLVDNGSIGKIGGETYFRRRLEKCISRHPTGPSRGCDIPVVCIVIEGGLFTLRSIGDYLHDDPPTPVVVFAGSGRTADFISWILKRLQQLPAETDIGVLREEIYAQMMRIYHVNALQCVVLFAEVRRIIEKKNLVTIYNLHLTDEPFDTVILGSIFRSQHFTPLQQLFLTLVWDRVDIAQSEVFVYGREWSAEHLEVAMMEALVFNRLEFVSLLLEHGVNMQRFLTVTRLEILYNTEHSRVLKLLVAELAKLKSRKTGPIDSRLEEIKFTIHDIGVAISHAMGHIYKSSYIHMMSNAMTTMSNLGLNYAGENTEAKKEVSLAHPFDDLFVWAVLSKRHALALLLWRHGQGGLTKSLIAIKLNKFISEQLVEKSNPNLAVDFQNYATDWENISFELVDSCFKQDQKLSRQLLTMELERWSKMTNLQLAVIGNHKSLLGHPSCQVLLCDLWMGALNIKSYSTLKVVGGIFFPFIIFFLEFKSTEELKLLPHQDKPLNPTHSRIMDDFVDDDMSDGTSLMTYESKSKSTFVGNVFHRHRHETSTKPDENMRVSKHMDHATHHPDSIKHFALIEKHENMTDSHVVIQTDNVRSIFPTEIKSAPSFPKIPGRQRQRSSFVTTQQSLSYFRKFYEFQRAPITNFYRHAFAYLIFVILLGYLILVPQDPKRLHFVEIYIVAYLISLGLEVCREFLLIDALNYAQKLIEFRSHIWQITDFVGVSFFMVGVCLRHTYYFEHGILIYRVSSIYWNIRESVSDSLSPQCGEGELVKCPVGYWIIPLIWAVYMMVANILIVNVLIAVFNGVYAEVDAMSLEVWLFQRFNFVMEVEGKHLLPPPLMIISHLYEILIWLYRKIKSCLCEQELETQLDEEDGPKIILGNDHRLKTYLTPAEFNIVSEFEEDNVAMFSNRSTFGMFSDDENGSFALKGLQRLDPRLTMDTFKDRQVQQLRQNFQELSSELESHREKLDRLLSYWEEELEQDNQDPDSLDTSETTSRTSRTYVRRTRTATLPGSIEKKTRS
ncbi:Transient receptor potential cation channel trpm [Folsomia candida]|uniref:Transient receptor potential cation channel trpm n=1 Tax=Folsomia candida TaxID=158441 RepID=A0A226EKD1_FOLCA|nr:Transient receptor potential cation channel trpm [Folsomia candida]